MENKLPFMASLNICHVIWLRVATHTLTHERETLIAPYLPVQAHCTELHGAHSLCMNSIYLYHIVILSDSPHQWILRLLAVVVVVVVGCPPSVLLSLSLTPSFCFVLSYPLFINLRRKQMNLRIICR